MEVKKLLKAPTALSQSHCIGGRINPGASLDVVVERMIFAKTFYDMLYCKFVETDKNNI